MKQKLYSSVLMIVFMGGLFHSSLPIPLVANEMDLTSMDIESLMQMKVISVGKKPQSLSSSAAAVFVITAEDIRRSGVTTIADALRMVPGVNVARVDSSKWAISARGFNSRFADKLLVLMDGRSLYTPFYSGVYWEVQDTMIEDIDRIEVIRGPGATLWGANAVNGVINIITKDAADTVGGLLTAGGGTYENAFARVRYGANLGQGIFGRLYAKADKRDELNLAHNQEDAGDNWGTVRGGFRLDGSLPAGQSVTVQGDIYRGDIDQTIILPDLSAPYSLTVTDEAEAFGGNFQVSWEKILSSSSNLTFKLYYDRTERQELFAHEESDIADMELQHRFSSGDSHDIVWGAHYRYIDDLYHENDYVFVPSGTVFSNLYSFFAQDEITLIQERLFLTLGSKFEYNDYTGHEVQPSIRLMWHPGKKHNIWAAVSRAVRTPSNLEYYSRVTSVVLPPEDAYNPLPFPLLSGIQGSEAIIAQSVWAHELGVRRMITPRLSMDVALFYNDYDDLRTFEYEKIDPFFNGQFIEGYMPIMNGGSGQSYGLEVAMACQPTDQFKIDAAYSYIHEDFTDMLLTFINESPAHQFSLRSAWHVSDDMTLDLWMRYVDGYINGYPLDLEASRYFIDHYLTCDFQLSYRLSNHTNLSLVGQNLFDSSRVEAVQEYYTYPTEIERSVYAKVSYRF